MGARQVTRWGDAHGRPLTRGEHMVQITDITRGKVAQCQACGCGWERHLTVPGIGSLDIDTYGSVSREAQALAWRHEGAA